MILVHLLSIRKHNLLLKENLLEGRKKMPGKPRLRRRVEQKEDQRLDEKFKKATDHTKELTMQRNMTGL